ESFCKKIANDLMDLFPIGYELEMMPISNLQLYNQDVDDNKEVPVEYSAFSNNVKECDVLLFVTPEYNRSVPGVLKNALDVGSRPKTDSVWNNKPAAIISMSLSNLSGFGANHHLRQSLVFFNMPVLQQPEAYLANVATLF